MFKSKNKNKWRLVGSLNQVPANVSYLADKANFQLSSAKIDLKWNADIQHIHIENNLKNDYYDDYLMTTSYSKKIQQLQERQLERMIDIYEEMEGRIPASLVEIGCGDGSFLKHAKNKISMTVGIEPSARFSAFATKQGCNVINGYVNSSSRITKDLFDCFVSRQVFEHLSDPLDVLLGIKAMLNPGAVGLIEVPNGYKSIRKKRFYDFFPDHVNYYSINSLVALAISSNFNVVSCHESFDGDYLELWVRNDTKKTIQNCIDDIEAERKIVCDNLLKKIKSLFLIKKKIMIFGCGAKTLSIFSGFAENVSDYISGVIDSDPNKIGKYVPNTSIQVLSMSQCVNKKPDVIIILALSYTKEIRDILKKELPKSVVLTLNNNVIIEL